MEARQDKKLTEKLTADCYIKQHKTLLELGFTEHDTPKHIKQTIVKVADPMFKVIVIGKETLKKIHTGMI